MYIGTDDGEDCVTIMPAHVDDTQVVRIAIKKQDRIHILYLTQQQFTHKLQYLAIQAAHPIMFALLKLVNWILVLWAIWKLTYG